MTPVSIPILGSEIVALLTAGKFFGALLLQGCPLLTLESGMPYANDQTAMDLIESISQELANNIFLNL